MDAGRVDPGVTLEAIGPAASDQPCTLDCEEPDLPGSQPSLANKFQCEGLVALLGVEVVELVQPNLLL